MVQKAISVTLKSINIQKVKDMWEDIPTSIEDLQRELQIMLLENDATNPAQFSIKCTGNVNNPTCEVIALGPDKQVDQGLEQIKEWFNKIVKQTNLHKT